VKSQQSDPLTKSSRPLAAKLGALPAKPGVYLFKDKDSKVIYVGKAANLKSRVRSYFGTPSNLPSKTQRLVSNIQDLELVVTGSEQEALILECDMIKKHTPRYNASLKDNKTFPYLKIDISEDWPGVCITRRVQKDGARYFGPFASAGSVRKTLRLIKKIFPYRSCSKRIDGKDKRPCLDYYIHQCLGPCIGAVEKDEYREVINQVILFLQGKQELILRELSAKMKAAAQQLQFERAALLRDYRVKKTSLAWHKMKRWLMSSFSLSVIINLSARTISLWKAHRATLPAK